VVVETATAAGEAMAVRAARAAVRAARASSVARERRVEADKVI